MSGKQVHYTDEALAGVPGEYPNNNGLFIGDKRD
jgi:hypothetical protein